MTIFLIILAIVLLASGIILSPISWEVLQRAFADRGMFWIRMYYNTCVVVLKDGQPCKILISCPDEAWEKFMVKYPRNDDPSSKDPRLVRISKDRALVWIGRFWVYTIAEWYETRQDEEDVRILPIKTADLAEQVYEFRAAKKKPAKDEEYPLEVPPFQTGDGVEATGPLSVFFRIVDPVRATFHIRYRKNAILKKIIPVYRETVAMFKYFLYTATKTTGEGDPEEAMERALIQLNSHLRSKLGMSIIACDIESKEEFETIITDPDQYSQGSVAYEIYHHWGTHVTDVGVQDFDAVDDDVRNSLKKILNAIAESLAEVKKAEGRKQSKLADAEGDADALKARSSALKEGGDDAKLIMQLDTLRAVGEGGKLVIAIPQINELLGDISARLLGGGKK